MSKSKGGRPKKGSPKLVAELVAAELVALRGNTAAVARKFGVARSSVVEFVQARPLLLGVQADVREGRLDDAESALDRAVIKGEGWAVCFLLKTQGKSRGYVERHEIDARVYAEQVTEVVVKSREEADKVLALNQGGAT